MSICLSKQSEKCRRDAWLACQQSSEMPVMLCACVLYTLTFRQQGPGSLWWGRGQSASPGLACSGGCEQRRLVQEPEAGPGAGTVQWPLVGPRPGLEVTRHKRGPPSSHSTSSLLASLVRAPSQWQHWDQWPLHWPVTWAKHGETLSRLQLWL